MVINDSGCPSITKAPGGDGVLTASSMSPSSFGWYTNRASLNYMFYMRPILTSLTLPDGFDTGNFSRT
ncbi:MAG: hypothetical protein IJ087_11325 [Eggerthellaceae bacterium]|nr:hypothetical protein [Eggerthellaceae bacterium]